MEPLLNLAAENLLTSGNEATIKQEPELEDNVEVYEVDCRGVRIKAERRPDEEIPLLEVVDEPERLPTNAELMALENSSPVFNLAQRFWKCWLIERTIQRLGNLEVNERFSYSDDIPAGGLE